MSIASKKAYVAREASKPHRDHECHARHCNRQVPPAYFMCPSHWRMVPRPLQQKIWELYAPGQEAGAADIDPEYLKVTDEAIEAVAQKEARR